MANWQRGTSRSRHRLWVRQMNRWARRTASRWNLIAHRCAWVTARCGGTVALDRAVHMEQRWVSRIDRSPQTEHGCLYALNTAFSVSTGAAAGMNNGRRIAGTGNASHIERRWNEQFSARTRFHRLYGAASGGLSLPRITTLRQQRTLTSACTAGRAGQVHLC